MDLEYSLLWTSKSPSVAILVKGKSEIMASIFEVSELKNASYELFLGE